MYTVYSHSYTFSFQCISTLRYAATGVVGCLGGITLGCLDVTRETSASLRQCPRGYPGEWLGSVQIIARNNMKHYDVNMKLLIAHFVAVFAVIVSRVELRNCVIQYIVVLYCIIMYYIIYCNIIVVRMIGTLEGIPCLRRRRKPHRQRCPPSSSSAFVRRSESHATLRPKGCWAQGHMKPMKQRQNH